MVRGNAGTKTERPITMGMCMAAGVRGLCTDLFAGCSGGGSIGIQEVAGDGVRRGRRVKDFQSL